MRAELKGKMSTPKMPLRGLIAVMKTLRPKQWTKNFFLFAGLVFSQNLFNPPMFFRVLFAFGVFCLLSGSAYIINDIIDVDEDRKHYIKRNRPLASGQISKKQAVCAFFVILAVSLSGAFLLGKAFLLVSILYFFLVAGYSLWFKHFVIIDVFAVAFGFLLRAVAGGVVIGVRISPWLLICTLLLALFLALVKRRHEYLILENNGTEHRRVLADYSIGYLDQLISIVTASTIMAYSLYTFTAERSEYFMLSIPFVIYGIFRYLFLVHKRGMGGSPEDVLLQDKPFIINVCLWAVVCVVILHFEAV